jgi:transcription-repair coupling factor
MTVKYIDGIEKSSIPSFLYDNHKKHKKNVLFITDSNRSAWFYYGILKKIQPEALCFVLPEFDSFFGEPFACSLELFHERASTFFNILKNDNFILITTVKAISHKTVPRSSFEDVFEIKNNDIVKRKELIEFLVKNCYVNISLTQEKGQFSVRGEVIDVFPVALSSPVRLNFNNDKVESVKYFDPESQITSKSINKTVISKGAEIAFIEESVQTFKDNYFERFSKINSILETESFFKGIEYFFPIFGPVTNIMQYFSEHLLVFFDFEIQKHNEKFFSQVKIIKDPLLLSSDEIFENVISHLTQEKEISQFISFDISNQTRSNTKQKKRADITFKNYNNLAASDYVVHRKHGIAKFDGIENICVNGIGHDFFALTYKDEDRLLIPVESIDQISRYGNADLENVVLDRLGSSTFNTKSNKLRKKIFLIADHLIKLEAQRKLQKSEAINIDYDRLSKFSQTFSYIETEDQLSAIQDVLSDLESESPMDRLICGDVGFGKTEIAIRAAFVVASAKQQVILLAPTTLLVKQHFETFFKRFKDFGIKICQLSRFVNKKEFSENMDKVSKGEIEIVVATHAVLSDQIKFKNIGLVIIDEEQHFGVKQKEFLKKIKANVNVMTMTATPIPRTLQLAVSGIRDLSIISTPPVDRLPIKTYICEYDKDIIKQAIEKEIQRDGQVFFVAPHIESLDNIEKTLKKLLPALKIAKCHGQMASEELEKTMDLFVAGKLDVFLSTNIIDSGIDIRNASSIFVYNADLFGLSQLYQLRGRVGRSSRQSYAYLFLPENRFVTEDAKKRLEAMKKMNEIGSGFNLASYDMDLRGCGNVVGEAQAGYIKDVGVELFQHMLREAVLMLKAGKDSPAAEFSPQINVSIPVFIPENYIEDINIRTSFYRRISDIVSSKEIEPIKLEFLDRFGTLPQEVINLLFIIKLKTICAKLNIDRVDIGKTGILVSFSNNAFDRPEILLSVISSNEIKERGLAAKIRPDQKIIIKKNWESISKVLKDVLWIFKQIGQSVSS